MKKIKKTLFFLTLLVLIVNPNVYARYHYEYGISAFSLKRDTQEILYNITKSNNDYTNEDIILEVTANKKINPIEGYTLSEDGKKLTKVFSENATETITLKDRSGNKKEVSYEINNIDKIPPQINGVENGKTYNTDVKPTYTDNIEVKDIIAEKYGTSLTFSCYTGYYDTSQYKGIDVTKNKIYIRISDKPKGTVKYRYYLNGTLKSETTDTEYTYTGLRVFTSYTVKVEALDKNNNVIGNTSKSIKTRHFESAEATKTNDTFTITFYGFDPSIKRVITKRYSASDRDNIKYETIGVKSDRSLTASIVATDVTPTIETGYYYLQVYLKGDNDDTIDNILCCIIFNTTYVKPNSLVDPYNLNQNGYYELMVTDLAGNITMKNLTIRK